MKPELHSRLVRRTYKYSKERCGGREFDPLLGHFFGEENQIICNKIF